MPKFYITSRPRSNFKIDSTSVEILNWYQGLPQPIPGLKCLFMGKDFRVSRLDSQGAFIFRKGNADEIPQKVSEMIFGYRDKEICCQGKPVRILRRAYGIGLRFQEMSADMHKNLGDFIELLRSEGHV